MPTHELSWIDPRDEENYVVRGTQDAITSLYQLLLDHPHLDTDAVDMREIQPED